MNSLIDSDTDDGIAICDEALIEYRAKWLGAEGDEKRATFEKINRMLDLRLTLMARRDTKNTNYTAQ